MTTEELLKRIVTPSSRLIVSTTWPGVAVKLVHIGAPTRMLAYGIGDTLNEALVSLDRAVNKGRYGNHVGGE